jgi:hypothetical protein
MYFLHKNLFVLEGLFIIAVICLIPLYYNDIKNYYTCFIGYCLTITSFTIRCVFKPTYLYHINNIIFCVGYSTGLVFYMIDGYVFRYISIVNLIKLHFYFMFLLLILIKSIYNLIFYKDTPSLKVVYPYPPQKKENKNTNEISISVSSVETCKICYTDDYNIINLKCSHFLCENCIYELKKNETPKCPFCRNELT